MKKVIIFEAHGGTDKGPDGYRLDTMPIVNALEQAGQRTEVVFFEPQHAAEILADAKKHAIAYVSRINPGNLANESLYCDMLQQLCDAGVIGFPHPQAMQAYGAKDALVKLRHTPLVPTDTFSYYSVQNFYNFFPTTLAISERVLKQNRGSTGEGIWRVQLVDETLRKKTLIPPYAEVKCTEAKDNHVEYHTLENFMKQCEQYIVGDNGMLIDMPYLPRIKEGEIRLLMIKDTPIHVVHKKPLADADAFSATLFSGAHYRYDPPSKWLHLTEHFLNHLPTIQQALGNYDLPLLWTADFMLDTTSDGLDSYVLGEMNCSCVGFSSQLNIAIPIAKAILDSVTIKA